MKETCQRTKWKRFEKVLPKKENEQKHRTKRENEHISKRGKNLLTLLTSELELSYEDQIFATRKKKKWYRSPSARFTLYTILGTRTKFPEARFLFWFKGNFFFLFLFKATALNFRPQQKKITDKPAKWGHWLMKWPPEKQDGNAKIKKNQKRFSLHHEQKKRKTSWKTNK